MTETYAPGTPSWVDLGTTDIAAAAGFYSGLFGWTHQDFGPEMGNYGMLLQDGKQVAGIGPAIDSDRGSSWATYFATTDVDDVAAKVEANDGTIVTPPMDVSDQGRMAVFTDPSGAYFSAWQAGVHKGAELVNKPNSLTWNELKSTDIAEAKSFYGAVFGLNATDVDMGGMDYTTFEVGGRGVAGGMQSDGRPAWTVYFAVADIEVSHAKALELGASANGELVDAPVGRFGIVSDPQGGTFGMIQLSPDRAA